MNAIINVFILLVLASVAHLGTAGDTVSATTALASNASTVTSCAEDDNVNIPVSGDVTSFFIEATNPIYPIGVDNCKANFTGCPPGTDQSCTDTFSKIYDDGTNVVQTVRNSCWWMPDGMTVTVDNGVPHTQVHFVVIYRKIADQPSWLQFLVLYADGNMRLKPHPPAGVDDVCFGSSVIIGPAARAARPFVQISSVNYHVASQTLHVTYAAGGAADIAVLEVSRTRARTRIDINYPTASSPFTTFRSMYVADGNADADHVQWLDACGAIHDDPVMSFAGGEGAEWLFHRTTRSARNTSAPDIRIWVPGATSSPVANFTAAPLLGSVPLRVHFSDSSTNIPTCWQWTFGDGSEDRSRNPAHTYKMPGNYTVSLTAANTLGSDTKTITNYVNVSSCPVDPVRVGTTGYGGLQNAYNNAADGSTIQCQALDFNGNLILDREIFVTVRGGFTCDYAMTVPETVLKGSLVIAKGSLSVDGLTVE